MFTLSQFEVLTHKVTIYVPSTVDVDQDGTDLQQVTVEKVLASFSNWFGGATAEAASQGAWMNGETLVIEGVIKVYSFASADAINQHLADTLALSWEIKNEMRQSEVAFEYDDQLYRIK